MNLAATRRCALPARPGGRALSRGLTLVLASTLGLSPLGWRVSPASADSAAAAVPPPPTYMRAAPERPARIAEIPADAWQDFVWQGIELDLRGRHDEADAVWDRLEASDPDDPEPWLRRVDTVYWRHWYDEGEGLADSLVRPMLDRAKRLAEARLEAGPNDLRARWLLGEILMQQARYEGMSGNYVKAGTLGERGRKQLETVLEVQPDHREARCTLGLYYYFASLMPSFVKAVNWLWFVPKGDRELGLRLLAEARERSTLYGPSASMVLMAIYTYHAPTNVPAAVEIARELHSTYPTNAILHFELLEVLLKAELYDELLSEAMELEARLGESEGVSGRALLARLWRARVALERGQVDEARAIAFEFGTDDPELPDWGAPWLWLVRGHVHDLEGDRASALGAYERVLELSSEDFYSERPQRMAEAAIETPYAADRRLDGPLIGRRD